jgi:hypothetical protein
MVILGNPLSLWPAHVLSRDFCYAPSAAGRSSIPAAITARPTRNRYW